MSGKYRIFEDGVLVSEQKNLLTTIGKRELLGIVAGTSSRISRLGLGVGGATPNVNDLTLQMPLVDIPVEFSVPLLGGASSKVVYKAKLPETVSGVIYEIGAYNGPEINEPLLLSFGDDIADTGATQGPAGGGTADVRIGPYSPSISTTTPYVITRSMTAGSLLPSDSIAIAVKPSNAVASVLTVTLTDINNLTAVVSFTLAASTNYQILSKTLSNFTSIAAGFDWNDIARCSVAQAAATNTIVLDGLAVLSPLQSGQLLSRATYTTPVVKRLGVRMDIEYELGFNLA